MRYIREKPAAGAKVIVVDMVILQMMKHIFGATCMIDSIMVTASVQK